MMTKSDVYEDLGYKRLCMLASVEQVIEEANELIQHFYDCAQAETCYCQGSGSCMTCREGCGLSLDAWSCEFADGVLIDEGMVYEGKILDYKTLCMLESSGSDNAEMISRDEAGMPFKDIGLSIVVNKDSWAYFTSALDASPKPTITHWSQITTPISHFIGYGHGGVK